MIKTKKAMAVQTIFYIFMSIIMIAIMMYGLKSIMSVQDQLSESERIEVQKKLKEKFELCDEPLNKGNIKYIKLKNQKFNSICIIGDDYDEQTDEIYNNLSSLSNFDDIKAINESGDNVILLKTDFYQGSVKKFNIITSFKIDTNTQLSECNFNQDNSNNFEYKLECK